MPLAGEELYCRKFQPNIFDPSRCLSCLRLRHLHTDAPPQEDSDSQSVVSSFCDVTGDRLHYEETSLCILSPDCHLYICNKESSTDSTQDPSEYPELSDSISQDEDYLPHKDRTSDSTMTRLDPPPHRPNPRAWMEEARGRDGFSSHTEFRGKRDHDSSYHSLGRAGGARSIRQKSPPPPHRHYEAGRPLPSHHSPEPKAAIPFRNPDLGVPSQRRSLDMQGHDPPQDNSVPSGYGQRSLSPTPFKQAESISSLLHQSYDDSYSRGHGPPYSSSHQQMGHVNTLIQGSSRSSSPSRVPSPFRQAELSSSSHKRSLDFSRGSSQGSRIPAQNSYGRILDSGSFQKNHKTVSCTIGSYSQSDSFGALKSSLHKTGKNVMNAKGGPSSRGSSPSRRGHETPNQSLLRKTDTKTSIDGSAWGGYGSSPSRRGYESPSQSSLHKTDTKNVTSSYVLGSSSPSRRGYDTPSQSQFRKYERASSIGTRTCSSRSCSPSRRSSGAPDQCLLRKTDSNKFSSGCDSRSPSASRKAHNTSSPSVSCRSGTKSPSSGRSADSRSPSPSRRGHVAPTSSLLRKTMSPGPSHIYGHNSCSSSPSGRAYDKNESFDTKVIHSTVRSDTVSYKLSKTTSQSCPSPGSLRSSAHSLSSPTFSRSLSPSTRMIQDHHLNTHVIKSRTVSSDDTNCRSRSSSSRRRPEAQSTSPENRQSCHQNRTPSPHMQRHTSSQSSLESESSHVSGGSVLNKEEYALMADLPKVKTIFDREGADNFGKTQRQTPGKEELYKPASHSQVKDTYREWHGLGDRGRGSGRENEQRPHEDRGTGQLSRTQSTSSLHTQRSSSPPREELNPWKAQLRSRPGHSQAQPDLLNFKKGWMSKLDEHGEWKKHWFVLTDAALKYYRDSAAEEKDDLDGEIDLRSCVKVSEFDVEKNYGFQIQTVNAIFTLSAMTAGIRKNWIEVLRKSVQPISSPDVTQLPDSSSDNSRSLTHMPSSHHNPSWQALNEPRSSVALSPAAVAPHRFDYVELAPMGEAVGMQHSSRRVPGEGQSREKGVVPTSEQKQRLEEEIEKKWAELEKLSLKKMSSLPLLGSLGGQSANEALQREVASLRQQLEQLQNGGGGVGAGGVCHGGSGSLCGRSLEAMERAHRQALSELQRRHEREMRELERERDKLLREEAQATAQAMEVLKKAHQEEMEREVEKIRRLGGGVGGAVGMEALQKQQQLERQALQRELDGLSERYSHKCLELNQAVKSSREREREISRGELEMEQLRKENQELQSRLTEEISHLRSVMTVQGSENNNREQNSCELEVLLRMKENEVQYLHKEIGCLRDELQTLNTEKQTACDRYKEVHQELSTMKNHSEREVETLREHLRLAMAALQEGQQLGNSLDH